MARAKADVAARGLVATVVQNFYAVVAAARKASSAEQSLAEARQFLDITQRQQRGGEVARSDVVKAQIQVEQRQRDAEDAELAALKSRLALSVLIFADFRDTFAVVDDLQTIAPLPPLDIVKALASGNSPDLKSAEAAVRQQSSAVFSARSGLLPSASFDYWYGIEANQFAVYDPEGHRLLGRFQPFSRDAHWHFIAASIARFDEARLHAGARAANRDPAPVFIVGMPRSGTTLAEQIIAAHPAAFGAALDARLRAAQDFIYVFGRASKHLRCVWSIGHEPTGFDVLAKTVDGWQSFAERKGVDLNAIRVSEWVGAFRPARAMLL